MIYLVRHCDYIESGKWIPGRLPVQLSPKGTEQAEKLRDFFLDKNIAKIYTSPVKRAMQSAEIIGHAVLTPIPDTRLLETMSAYQGQRYEGEVDWHDLYAHRHELGGESFLDQHNRMLSFWNEVINDERENIVIVSHGHPLWALYCSLIGFTEDASLLELTLQVSRPEEYQVMGSVRPVKYENGNWTVEPLIVLS